ncbi:MAG TPA: DUF6298 domain-containing protein [Vicinamibacterales bacterium]|jgi:hypothetical protein
MKHGWSSLMLALLAAGPGVPGAARAQTSPLPATRPAISVTQGGDGRLVYTSDPAGNRIIDFSHAGYAGGGPPLPDVPARIVVPPLSSPRTGGTSGRLGDRARIQAAIDLVSSMPADGNGFRGAVLLEKGTYFIDGGLRIATSGVVLRGAGRGEDGSVLVATGTSRRSLIVVAGQGDRTSREGDRRRITDPYVPVGARSFSVDDARGLARGATVLVHRPSTAAWIGRLGMNQFPGWRPDTRLNWPPGSRDVRWDRVITAVDGNRVTVDAPLTTAIEQEQGGGSLVVYAFAGRIEHVGVEDLRLVSEFEDARPFDEDHAWFALTLDKLANAWVRRVAGVHFVSSVVNAQADTKWVTVEDCESWAPVSEIGGYRRRAFYTAGQLTLFERCRSERARRDFAVGFAAAGPNVFLDCASADSLDYSGTIESWASGVLFDNVTIRGNAIRLTNRGVADQGAGWTAANSVLWNCAATDVEVQSPPGATNQAYGCKGVVTGDGIIYDPRTMPYRDFYRGTAVQPRSLYQTQLEERIGAAAARAKATTPGPPAPSAALRRITDAEVDAFIAREAGPRTAGRPLTISHARFVAGGRPVWTSKVNWSWFQAQMPRSLAEKSGPAITRFAPGIVGRGATDDLEEMAAALPAGAAFYQHYGLWYDRRRVDHNYYGSPEERTGDVWAPFIELPWGRSGQGKAWDGLSKYDLTRFNPWFFERIRTFADIADRRGLVLYHHFYFQHWLVESRAHYVDFPWRPVNAIQATDMPDEVPAANTFYDVSHPVRRELHRLYIRHALDVLKDNTNVVHGIDREYSGPIEFVQFWLDTIREWEQEHGKRLFISLEIPKAWLDAILSDPVRGSMVSAIDVHHWIYRPDGRLFAIRGGLNRAPREQRPDIASAAELESLKSKLGISLLDQKDFLNGPEFQRLFDQLWASTKPMRYRTWREYRDRHPDLVILFDGDEYPALTKVIEGTIPASARAAAAPTELVRSPRETSWCLAQPGASYVVYSMNGEATALDLTADAAPYSVSWLDSDTGRLTGGGSVQGGALVTLVPPATGRPSVAWLRLVTK